MWFLALRHLLSKKKQTGLMLAGITLGTAAYCAISGMMLGFQTFIIDQLVNNDSHIRVSSREEIIGEHSLDRDLFPDFTVVKWKAAPAGRRDYSYIEYPAGWFEKFDKDENTLAYSPQLIAQVIASRARVSTSARMIGVEPFRQAKVTNIQNYMLQGQFTDLGQTGNRIIIGDGLLNRLGTKVSESIQISSGKVDAVPFKIVGVFHLGVKNLDDTTIFGALGDVQKVNATPSRISDIAVKIRDVGRASELAATWSMFAKEKVQSWDQANEGIMSVFKTQNVVRYSMTVSILIVAGFGIYNILTMAIQQKKREIAILRSIGFEPKDVLWHFELQGMALGLIGGLIGITLGYFICLAMSHIEVSPNRGLGGRNLMVSFDIYIYIRAFLMSFIVSAAAGVLPARAAGLMTPIDIIRSEGS